MVAALSAESDGRGSGAVRAAWTVGRMASKRAVLAVCPSDAWAFVKRFSSLCFSRVCTTGCGFGVEV